MLEVVLISWFDRFSLIKHAQPGDLVTQFGGLGRKINAVSHKPKLNRSFRVYHIYCYWMNIQVDPTSCNLASAMLNLKIRSVAGYSVKIFHPSPPNYVTRSPGIPSFFNAHFSVVLRRWKMRVHVSCACKKWRLRNEDIWRGYFCFERAEMDAHSLSPRECEKATSYVVWDVLHTLQSISDKILGLFNRKIEIAHRRWMLTLQVKMQRDCMM